MGGGEGSVADAGDVVGRVGEQELGVCCFGGGDEILWWNGVVLLDRLAQEGVLFLGEAVLFGEGEGVMVVVECVHSRAIIDCSTIVFGLNNLVEPLRDCTGRLNGWNRKS